MDDALRALEIAVWPVVTVVALVTFRQPLGRAFEALAGRATKLNLSVIAFEFAPTMSPDWVVDVATDAVDVRTLTSDQIFDSYSHSLFTQLAVGEDVDVAVVDLEAGTAWLTTRLYLFASVLESERGVRCIVFQRTLEGRSRQVLGLATPSSLRQGLASAEPWLEATYLSARSKHRGVRVRASIKGRTIEQAETWDEVEEVPPQFDRAQGAMQVARQFVHFNQRRNEPPLEEKEGWLHFEAKTPGTSEARPRWEHTQWIDGAALPQGLESTIDVRSLVTIDPSSPDERAQRRQVLMHEGDFVALVNTDGTLRGVVDRRLALDRQVRQQLGPDARGA